MEIKVCIGSSCHLKGSHRVVEGLQKLIEENGLSDKLDFKGAFCMGLCQPGVSVKIDNEVFSVKPEELEEFFEKNIKAKI
ncbi:MAG: NAD(P)H-dependent oxidoreductase subunit E [Clostridia bacterium]|nr:NAD(P)H-dependent oxidoreductase subunit E [Clostridia bacterium]MBQ9848996.1 NAD(P)H-dependent oxidoreductase subunit E [Clostridia bacterium]